LASIQLVKYVAELFIRSLDCDVSSKRPSTIDPNVLAGDEIRSRPEQIKECTDQVVGRFLAADAARVL
jgi:hypothetical protein